jgi:hypothetical protein
MMKVVNVKKINTESIEAKMSRKDKIKSTVEIKTQGVGCWNDETPIEVGLTASGTIIVHECKEIFMRADELGELTYVTSDEGVKYVYISFKAKKVD